MYIVDYSHADFSNFFNLLKKRKIIHNDIVQFLAYILPHCGLHV